MHLHRKYLNWFKLCLTLLFLIAPCIATASGLALSINNTVPFSSTYLPGATASATYVVTNTSSITLNVVNISHFPADSGLSVTSNTCGSLAPAATCTIELGLTVPANPQTINTNLILWPQPTSQGIKTPIVINIVDLTVTATAGSNGSLSPSGTLKPLINDSINFTATPDADYTVNEWKVDDVVEQTGGTTYTLSSITTDHTVDVSFIRQYTVTASAGSNGSISLPATEQITTGQPSSSYTATPAANYTVSEWTVNGSTVQTGGTTYQIPSVTEDSDINVTFKTATGIGIGVGSSSGPVAGLVALTTNGGLAWNTVTFTPALTNIVFSAGTCVGSGTTAVCLAAGRNTSTNEPSLYGSMDSGTSWESEVVTDQPALGIYNAVACTGLAGDATCIAAGRNSTDSEAMIALSKNGATTWAKVPLNTPPDGTFLAAACTGSGNNARCFAGGQDTSTNAPLIAASTDNGDTWNFVTIGDAPPPNGVINGASCSGTGSLAICVGVGHDAGSNNAFIAQSTDGASTWSTIGINGAPADAILHGVSCVGEGLSARCVAVGQNLVNDSPLVTVTTDGGSMWTIPTISGAPATAVLNSVSCSGTGDTAVCAAAGNETGTPPNAPFIAISTDGGETWSSATIASAPSNAVLSRISCTGTTSTTYCAAFGQDDTDGIIIQTRDSGATNWTLPTITGLPANSDLNGGGVSGGTLRSKTSG